MELQRPLMNSHKRKATNILPMKQLQLGVMSKYMHMFEKVSIKRSVFAHDFSSNVILNQLVHHHQHYYMCSYTDTKVTALRRVLWQKIFKGMEVVILV